MPAQRIPRARGADLLWRVKKNMRLPVEKPQPDGSYGSRIDASEKDRRHGTDGGVVRVIDYRLEGVADAEPLYRLVTTILDPNDAPAGELAALYDDSQQLAGEFFAQTRLYLRRFRKFHGRFSFRRTFDGHKNCSNNRQNNTNPCAGDLPFPQVTPPPGMSGTAMAHRAHAAKSIVASLTTSSISAT